MERQIAEPTRAAAGPSNMMKLSLLLNAILLGWVGYAQFGRDLIVGDGVSIVLANDTDAALIEPTIEFPGGNFKLPELSAGKSVGTSIQVPGRFDATLTCKDAAGASHSRKFLIKPIGELLVVLHVLPEPATVPAASSEGPGVGGEAIPPSPRGFRVIVSYQGENTNI
ncbi:hypothetical protein [Paludisphaera soli]|uniref:hypothetical protein n=1 Tax=Paludisphaera soli TaxID=2712865 RepID=UPI0013EB1055|nr:hypothetical protein [Paludisphaera soli]